MIPKQQVDEADVDVKSSVGVDISEVVDDGSLHMREDQEMSKFKAERDAILQPLAQTVEAKDIWQPGTASTPAAPAAPDAREKDADKESAEGSSDSDAPFAFRDNLTSSLLGGLVGAASPKRTGKSPGSKSKVAQDAPGSPPKKLQKKMHPFPLRSPMKKKHGGGEDLADVSDDPDVTPSKKTKGKGKGSRLPLDPHALLEFEGFSAIKASAEDMAEQTGPPTVIKP